MTPRRRLMPFDDLEADAAARHRISRIPRIWCEACGESLRPADAVVGHCPSCDEAITLVLVDAREWHELREVSP